LGGVGKQADRSGQFPGRELEGDRGDGRSDREARVELPRAERGRSGERHARILVRPNARRLSHTLRGVNAKNGRGRHDRADLKQIARRAMVEKGLEPDFSRDALAELAAIRGAAPVGGPGIRALREGPWVSTNNDDSRALDQLTVSEPLPGGAVKVFVAIADVDALVPKGGDLAAHRAGTPAS